MRSADGEWVYFTYKNGKTVKWRKDQEIMAQIHIPQWDDWDYDCGHYG